MRIFEFLEVISSIYLNRHVFVMNCADVQADLGLRCLHMSEDTFSYGVGHLTFTNYRANSADGKLIFSRKIGFDLSC